MRGLPIGVEVWQTAAPQPHSYYRASTLFRTVLVIGVDVQDEHRIPAQSAPCAHWLFPEYCIPAIPAATQTGACGTSTAACLTRCTLMWLCLAATKKSEPDDATSEDRQDVMCLWTEAQRWLHRGSQPSDDVQHWTCAGTLHRDRWRHDYVAQRSGRTRLTRLCPVFLTRRLLLSTGGRHLTLSVSICATTSSSFTTSPAMRGEGVNAMLVTCAWMHCP